MIRWSDNAAPDFLRERLVLQLHFVILLAGSSPAERKAVAARVGAAGEYQVE